MKSGQQTCPFCLKAYYTRGGKLPKHGHTYKDRVFCDGSGLPRATAAYLNRAAYLNHQNWRRLGMRTDLFPGTPPAAGTGSVVPAENEPTVL